jgi:hypothetical protein
VTQPTPTHKTRERIRARVPGVARPTRRTGPTPGVPSTQAGRCNSGMTTSAARDYGLSPALRARLMGVFLGGVGLALLVVTLAVAIFQLSADVIAFLVVLIVLGIFVLGFLLVRSWYVVRLDETGYQVRFVRGAGESRARWLDVEDLTTAIVGGTECVVLRLRDGRTTTIPVNLIEGDREEFVDELQRRLDGGHGYRRL